MAFSLHGALNSLKPIVLLLYLISFMSALMTVCKASSILLRLDTFVAQILCR